MAVLSDVMLSLAKTLGGVEVGVATGGSTTTLIDTAREENPEYWVDGVLFGLSGDNDGEIDIILQYDDDGTITVDTKTDAYANGNRYALSRSKFPKYKLRMAINNALSECLVLLNDASLVVLDDTQSYSLPSEVSNVVAVEVATSESSPYDYQFTYYFRESHGSLHFVPGKEPSSADKKIRLWYKRYHPEVTADTDTIYADVDLNWLRWAATVHAYRDLISVQEKDSTADIELMNEAAKKELAERNRAQGAWLHAIKRSPMLGTY